MKKALPTGCVKKSTKIASWRDINPLIEKLNVGNKIGHLFVADLCFNERKANEKT